MRLISWNDPSRPYFVDLKNLQDFVVQLHRNFELSNNGLCQLLIFSDDTLPVTTMVQIVLNLETYNSLETLSPSTLSILLNNLKIEINPGFQVELFMSSDGQLQEFSTNLLLKQKQYKCGISSIIFPLAYLF